MHDGVLTMLLCGDVMLGRGVDQILPHPGDPTLRERSITDARDYVALAEAAHGPVPRPAGFAWPWGDALPVLDKAAPDVRVLNLETSITRSDDFAPRKAVHYRMNPANLPSLTSAHPDVCALANNHVLDFGHAGLADTLDALSGADVQVAGAGRDIAAARRPAAVPVDSGRVIVFSVGMPSSGIPGSWAATRRHAGIDVVPEPSGAAAAELTARVERRKRAGDIVVASVHWGSNWGYDISASQVRFAHRLIDGGVDVVHGHSSHHPRPIEVYRDRLVLYGCGDLVDDYEGITGHEEFRDDLRLLYLALVEGATGRLVGLRMVPMQARHMRLRAASSADTAWLRDVLDRISRGYGARIGVETDGALGLRPPARFGLRGGTERWM